MIGGAGLCVIICAELVGKVLSSLSSLIGQNMRTPLLSFFLSGHTWIMVLHVCLFFVAKSLGTNVNYSVALLSGLCLCRGSRREAFRLRNEHKLTIFWILVKNPTQVLCIGISLQAAGVK